MTDRFNIKNKRELINYIIFGVLTTVINIISYVLLTKLHYLDFKTATTIAWLLSVLFAFVTNKLYVFNSRETNLLVITKELGSFLLSRVLSYGLDILTMILLVQVLNIDDLIAKVIANVLVIVFNYAASKLFVFKEMVRSVDQLDHIYNHIVYILTFIIPFAILGLAYLVFGMYPSGDKTVLICDMSGQYVDFYSTYYDIFTQGKSLLYSWYAGMGLNFLGLFAYYLSSPFALILLLFEKQHLTEALLLVTLLKVGSSGLTFSIYAKYTLNTTKLPAIIFSTLYALMAYSVVYTFNLMWLDGVVFLPLVLLGTEKILQENKHLLFIFSLITIFFANFYIAYMIGIFSFLYFLAAFFSGHSLSDIRLLARKLILFCLSALLAAGCAAILLIPTYFALKNGQGGPDLSLLNLNLNFKLFDLVSKTQLGAYDTLKYKGLPNIYCGLITLLLLPLYFLNKSIPMKEKVIYSALLGFLVMSFYVSMIDIMWHAFDRPDWFPNRYSFVFSFLLIFLAVRGFNHLDTVWRRKIASAAAFWLIFIIVLQKINYAFLSDKLLTISLFLFLCYALLLTGLTTFPQKRNVLLLALTGLILIESSINTWYLIKRLDVEYSYILKQDYAAKLDPLQNVLPEIGKMDNGFYRVDRIGGRTYNDPMNLNYSGITHFSSMSSMGMNKTLRQLGFLTTAGYKSVNFAGSTPITDSLLGVKYVISPKPRGVGYEQVVDQGQMKVYRNKNFLPIGFTVDKAVSQFDSTKDDNPFELQNKLINLAQGNVSDTGQEKYFRSISVKDIKLSNATISMEKGKEVYRRIDTSGVATVEYTLVNPIDQQVYVCFQTIDNTVQIFVNDEEIIAYLPIYNKKIVDLGFHEANKKIRVKLAYRNEGFALAQKYFYGLSEPNLTRALDPLKDDVLENVKVADTSVSGKISIKDGKMLFTSIPYDPGWQVWVDGNKTPMSKIGNAFIGVELTEGQHDILFKFSPSGFKLGMIISLLSVLVLILLMIVSFFDSLRLKRLPMKQ